MTKERFDWIVRALDADLLTDWELRFLGDCERRLKGGKDLSDRQEEILERIHREKC